MLGHHGRPGPEHIAVGVGRRPGATDPGDASAESRTGSGIPFRGLGLIELEVGVELGNSEIEDWGLPEGHTKGQTSDTGIV